MLSNNIGNTSTGTFAGTSIGTAVGESVGSPQLNRSLAHVVVCPEGLMVVYPKNNRKYKRLIKYDMRRPRG